jgi:hypothetical protein
MMKNSFFLTLFLMIASFLAGAICMRLWDGARLHTQAVAENPRGVESASLLVMDLKEGKLPEGIYEAEQAENVRNESDMPPSQLADVKIEGFESVYVAEEKQPADPLAQMPLPPQKADPVTIATTSTVVNVLPTARVPVNDEDESTITLIQLPVSVKTIKTQDEYKQFKRTARGQYPEVNFQKEMVIVLLSESNMPDNMLEIVKVTPLDDKLEVTYRVNVFGLDQKTNTHSVAVTEKSKKEIVLKQVR